MPGSIFEWARFGKCVKVSDRIFRWKKKKIVRMDRSLNRLVIIFFTSEGTIGMNPFDSRIRVDERSRKFDGSNERVIYIYVYRLTGKFHY